MTTNGIIQKVQSVDKVLGAEIAKKTPAWSAGIATVIISVSVSFIAVYTFTGSNIQNEQTKNSVLSSILSLVHTNGEQITNLSNALYVAQQNNVKLADRVGYIEKELAVTQTSLEKCKEDLIKGRKL